MKMRDGHYGTHEQKLILTPDMRYSLAILAMPLPELAAHITQELQENCALELLEDGIDSNVDTATEAADEQIPEISLEDRDSRETPADPWEIPLVQTRLRGEEFSPQSQNDPGVLEVTLRDHLSSQLHLAADAGEKSAIGEFLIGNIDDDGYLRCSLEEAASALGVYPGEAGESLELIQTFEPIGVGARDLRECLTIQMEVLKRTPDSRVVYPERIWENATVIVRELLKDLVKGGIARIARQLQQTTTDIQQAVDLIRSLDPKPGRHLSGPDSPPYILPDLTVSKISGDYLVQVHEAPAQRLSVSAYYRNIRTGDDGFDRAAASYLRERVQAAFSLIKSIERRRMTLQQVMETILALQRNFFDHGPAYLRPLTLKDVAEIAGIHESTVSRATAGKYAATTRGLFPLSYFFLTGLTSVTGEMVASASIKGIIRELIAGEDTGHPVSDRKITTALADRAIRISRRTVAKYREEMRIPASDQRRRY